MDQSEKVRENRLRAMAKRQGLELSKSRRRDPRAVDYGGWMIVEPDTKAIVAGASQRMSLEGVEAFLERPMIEAELSRAGRAYVESRGANRDELRRLVHEAIKMGMPAEAVVFVTGVSLEDVTAMNRQAEQGGA
jgi:hypothetical protein